ncbi:hypothetical protein AB6A23_22305 [Paenibacillus tarimensis]
MSFRRHGEQNKSCPPLSSASLYGKTVCTTTRLIVPLTHEGAGEETQDTAQLKHDLDIHKLILKKLIARQKKQDNDYYVEKLKAQIYNRLSEAIEIEINETKQIVNHIEKEIEKLLSNVIITKEVIIEALESFNYLFKGATNEEKRALLRALIKEIHVNNEAFRNQ